MSQHYDFTQGEQLLPFQSAGIVLLFLFCLLLLLIDNQSVLLPPEDEFDEYVANFLPYFFFGEK